MAQPTYTPIQLYHSTTAFAAPTAANLAQGELAINITDGKLYYEDGSGVVQVIASKGAGTIGGSTTQIQYNNAGALAGSSAMVFNNSTNVVTLTTLNLTNALGAVYGGTGQSTYTTGDLLYSSAANTLSKLAIGTANYILTVNSGGTNVQWSAPSSISVSTATNLAGGLAGSVPYQSGASTTTFLAIGAADRVMTSSGSAPQWVTALTGLTGVSSSSITNTSLTSTRVVYSGASGLQTNSANLTFDGTTLTTAGLSNSGTSALVKLVTVGNTSFNGTTVFAPATPAKLYMGTGTVTDVTSAVSATNTTGAIASLAITPIAASNTGVTYTNASTLYIAGAPSAGTNITITNPYALYVAAGASYLQGLTVTSLTDSGLTAGRVTYASTGGLLADSVGLTFDATNANLTITSGVTGQGFTQYSNSIDGGVQGYVGSGKALVAGSGNTTLGVRGETSIFFGIGSVYAMGLNSAGNLGLNVTPAAWNASVKVFQINNCAIYSYSNAVSVTNNYLYTTGGGDSYISNGYATQLLQRDGQFQFYTAPSGTGGNPITTFNRTMTLSEAGELAVGTTSTTNYILRVNAATPLFGMMVSGTQAFTIGANSGGGATFYYGSGNAEAAKITTGGVFNANTLQTSGTAVGTFSASKWFIQSEDSTTTRAYYTGPDASTKGVWEIYAATSTGSAVLAGRFNASANFVAQNIGLGATIPTTSGTGITFPATQSASTNANTLDDYEEGATTIYFADATSGGNAYGISAGYIKIGRFVFLQFAAYYVSSPTWTAGNTIYIRNLPFATSGEGCAGTFMLNTTLGNTVSVYAWQPNAATYFVLTQNLFTSPIIGSEMTTQLLTYGNLVYATDS